MIKFAIISITSNILLKSSGSWCWKYCTWRKKLRNRYKNKWPKLTWLLSMSFTMLRGVIDQEEGLHGWLLAKLLFVVWQITGKNNRFPFLYILWYLKNTHKNPKFGRVRQVPIRELGWNSLVGTCLTLPNLGFLWVFFKYPKISNIGNLLFFLWICAWTVTVTVTVYMYMYGLRRCWEKLSR